VSRYLCRWTSDAAPGMGPTAGLTGKPEPQATFQSPGFRLTRERANFMRRKVGEVAEWLKAAVC